MKRKIDCPPNNTPKRRKLYSKPYRICNWTLQKKVKGFYYIGSDGFIKLTKLIPGFKFFKQRNDQMEFKIHLNEYIKRDCKLPIRLKKPIIKVILSNCTDKSVLIKIIGVKSAEKVNFGFEIVQEILGNIPNPRTGRLMKYDLEFTELTTTNVVVSWAIPKEILMDFEIIKMNFGNMCSYQPSKIPLMRLRFRNDNLNSPNFMCILSQSGQCTVPGLKSLDNIIKIQTIVEDVFFNLWDQKSRNKIKEGLERKDDNIDVGVLKTSDYKYYRILKSGDLKYLKEIEEAEADRLHFIKNESYFNLVGPNGKRTKPKKYFNKAAVKKPKKKFDDRLNSLKLINPENIPPQGIQFYFGHQRLLSCQGRFIL